MRFIFRVIFLFLFFITIQARAEVETYKIDPGHSHVIWTISHFDFSHPSGKWMVEGTLMLDEKNPQNSKVSVTIPLNNMITGIPKLDAHMRGSDFFDVAKYPVATFVSDKIQRIGTDKAKVHGILTMHGVSKPVVLDVKLNKMGISPVSNKKTVGFTAKTQLKRADFGINAFLPGLGNEVKIDIEAEAFTPPG